MSPWYTCFYSFSRLLRPSHLPIAFITCTILGLILSYSLSAFYQEDVSPLFPRISHTGNHPPASMVFSFTLGAGAILLVAVTYATFSAMRRLVEFKFDKKDLLNGEILLKETGNQEDTSESTPKEEELSTKITPDSATSVAAKTRHLSVNIAGLVCGVLSALGTLGVGTFQVAISPALHNLALLFMIGPGYTFFIIHTFHSRTLLKDIWSSTRTYFIVRLCLLVGGVLCLVGMGGFSGVAWSKWVPSVPCTEEEKEKWGTYKNCSVVNGNWNEKDGGFEYFVAANVCQWSWLASFFGLVFSLRHEIIGIPVVAQS